MTKRNTFEIIRDILVAISLSSSKRGICLTHIISKANLTSSMTHYYLKILVQSQLVTSKNMNDRDQFFITVSGKERLAQLNYLINEYRQLQEIFKLKGGIENGKKEN